ncbi:hypothetical protein LTS18_000415, partial [Coniosporium uncinatum]
TTSEVVAEYNNDVRRKQSNDGRDRFNFNIKLSDQANLETKTLLLCVRYNVAGQEFWDNNGSTNFQVDFVKKTKPQPPKVVTQGATAGPLGNIPRSRHSPPATKARTTPASPDDDFAKGFDRKYEFGPRRVNLGESSNNTLRFKKRKGSVFPTPEPPVRTNAAGQAFSTRYDFGASLSAALSNAQNALGDRSGLTPRAPAVKEIKTQKSAATEKSAAPAVTAPGAMSSEKPDLKSAEYNELIQKYCFVRTPKAGLA